METMNNEQFALPMIPLRGLNVFPGMFLTFEVERASSLGALGNALNGERLIFLSAQTDMAEDVPEGKDIYSVGVVCRIRQQLRVPRGNGARLMVEGLYRAEALSIATDPEGYSAVLRALPDKKDRIASERLEALVRNALSLFEEYIHLNSDMLPEQILDVVSKPKPAQLAYYIAQNVRLPVEDKQKILEALDPDERLVILNELLLREVEILKIEQDINTKVKSRINRNQREYYLREQLQAIQSELDGEEAEEDEIQRWRKTMDEKELPEAVRAKVEGEIKRLTKMQSSGAEASVIRTYIDTILALPWNVASEAVIDLPKAEAILDEDHYGLEQVKERVLEFLAVMELSDNQKAPILCLVGPPGTGKTSIVRSMARAMGREYVRMSLGGVRDEAEIRGHRRTYIGAIPGRIINCIKDAGTKNPIFLFDEVDKLGADYRGDPSSALLEVLDPEQNKDFTDHYLEVPFDLSQVVFVTTANNAATIPRPLLDRMELIEVTGYTKEDKIQIAKHFLVPKKMKEHGLTRKDIRINDSAVGGIIDYYTRESGVRNLEREIANLCRKVARKIVTVKEKPEKPYSITGANLEEYLGKKRYHFDKIRGAKEVGVTTGMAWTAVGGETLFIETVAVPGSGKIQLTGMMGDVMQESARTGISYIRTVTKKYKIDQDFYKTKDIHIHIPEGAVPKDGPSAGVTMAVAMLSTLTGRAVRKDVAMTGEITLTGKVLPVGGIREKVLAAHRAGIRKVLLPADNVKDIDEIPEKVREQMTFVFLKRVEDAVAEVMVPEKNGRK